MEKITHIVFDHDGTLVDTTRAPRRLYTGIKDLLSKLSDMGIPLYVWTARHRHSTVEILRSLAIMEHFKEVSTPDDATAKPSTEGLEQMLYGVNPSEVVVIGDSRSDMYGGKEFGAKCVGVIWDGASFGAADILKAHGADEVVTNINDLENWLMARIDKNV